MFFLAESGRSVENRKKDGEKAQLPSSEQQETDREDKKKSKDNQKMSVNTIKHVFIVSDKVWHKPGMIATVAS